MERIREMNALGLPSALIARELRLTLRQVYGQTQKLDDAKLIPYSLAWREARVQRIKRQIAMSPGKPLLYSH